MLSRRDFNLHLLRATAAGILAPACAARAVAEEPVFTSSIGTAAAGAQPHGKLATQTEIVAGSEAPMVSPGSPDAQMGAIAMYEEIVAGGGWDMLAEAKYKKGGKGKHVFALRQRLISEGYIPFDTLGEDGADLYDAAMEDAVRAFQINHGVLPSGLVAEKTLAQLNIMADVKLRKLQENMFRVQAYAQGLGERYILVNIPGAQLETVEGGRVFSRHNVVVGRLERPSPALASKVSDINFNPYWKIPASIVEKDIVPKYLEDPSYLQTNHIRVFDGVDGPEIDPETVDWFSTPPERYFFRQEPGEHNSLGTVKINFPNEHMVYMHDTPHRELFGRNVRFESSGCVRIDQVQTVIDWILRDEASVDLVQVQAIASSTEPYDLKVENGPDVRFMYLTAWANEDGRVNFRPDIYGLDGTGFIMGQPEPTAF